MSRVYELMDDLIADAVKERNFNPLKCEWVKFENDIMKVIMDYDDPHTREYLIGEIIRSFLKLN